MLQDSNWVCNSRVQVAFHCTLKDKRNETNELVHRTFSTDTKFMITSLTKNVNAFAPFFQTHKTTVRIKVQSLFLPEIKNDSSVCRSQAPKASKRPLQLLLRNTQLSMSLFSNSVNKVFSKLKNSPHHPEHNIILALKF